MRRLPWVAVNAVGMALGFLAFLETLFLLQHGTRWELHWTDVPDDPVDMGTLRLGLAIGLPLAGACVAGLQALYLRRAVSSAWLWAAAGPAGFAAILLVVWPLAELGVWGSIPGPVEPLAIVGGGLLLTSWLQQRLLPGGSDSRRWSLLWMLGLPLGLVLSLAIVYGWYLALGSWPSWAVEVSIYGASAGGTAAVVSAGPLFRAVDRA